MNDETFTAAKKKDKQTRAASTASAFGSNRVAERIAMVVMTQAMTQAEAAGSEATDDDWFFSMLVIVVVANFLLLLFYGLLFLRGHLRTWQGAIFPRDRVPQVSVGIQTEVCSTTSGLVLVQSLLDEPLAAYYTLHGTCWHSFKDCHTLQNSPKVYEKGHLCKICVDRARAQH